MSEIEQQSLFDVVEHTNNIYVKIENGMVVLYKDKDLINAWARWKQTKTVLTLINSNKIPVTLRNGVLVEFNVVRV